MIKIHKRIIARKEDKVFFKKDRQQKNNILINILGKKNNVIRVLRGPQFNYFSKTAQEEFFSREYKIDAAMLFGGATLIGVTQWSWGEKSGPNLKDEGGFGADTKYAGVDKLGHLYSSYILNEILNP